MENKKILLIGPDFFGYLNLIQKELKKYFQEVDLIFDSYKITKKDRILRKILKNYEENKLKIYYEKILKKVVIKKYTHIFIIKGDKIFENFLISIKNQNPEIKIINYQWDDIINCHQVEKNFKYYDKIFTYSINDSVDYKLKFRPFFYEKLEKNDEILKDIDYLFVGSYHSGRLEKINYLMSELIKREKEIKVDIYIYIDTLTLIKNLLNISPKLYKYLKIKKLSYQKYKKKLMKSKVIIDISHEKQKGLTTRFFEAIPAQTKVLTTSSEVSNYEVYIKENIKSILLNNLSDEKIKEIITWKECEYKKINEKIIEKYSISYWVKEIFTEDI